LLHEPFSLPSEFYQELIGLTGFFCIDAKSLEELGLCTVKARGSDRDGLVWKERSIAIGAGGAY
jgi:hypothetical protein